MNYDISIERDDAGRPTKMYFSPAPDIPVFKRGDRVMAFAWWEWEPVGDVGDNSCFWKPATVLHFYHYKDNYFVDLFFDCGRESRGYFAYGLKPIEGAEVKS